MLRKLCYIINEIELSENFFTWDKKFLCGRKLFDAMLQPFIIKTIYDTNWFINCKTKGYLFGALSVASGRPIVAGLNLSRSRFRSVTSDWWSGGWRSSWWRPSAQFTAVSILIPYLHRAFPKIICPPAQVQDRHFYRHCSSLLPFYSYNYYYQFHNTVLFRYWPWFDIRHISSVLRSHWSLVSLWFFLLHLRFNTRSRKRTSA